MKSSLVLYVVCLVSVVSTAPTSFLPRADTACFVIGNNPLPAEVTTAVDAVKSQVTCDTGRTTIGGVPDVISGSVSFSDIDFSKSKASPLGFALATFKTANKLTDTSLDTLQDQLNVYIATQAGIRSGTMNPAAIKIPTFFLQFQMARVKAAKGMKVTNPAETVEHQLGKVLKNAAVDSKALLDQVTALSQQIT